MNADRGLLRELLGDGRPALSLTAVALLLSGLFAIFLSFRREFLPHDVNYLGMSAAELCRFADCRVVRFMFHDRVAFGGTLIAVGVLYLWLAAFPLRQGAAWAWWVARPTARWRRRRATGRRSTGWARSGSCPRTAWSRCR